MQQTKKKTPKRTQPPTTDSNKTKRNISNYLTKSKLKKKITCLVFILICKSHKTPNKTNETFKIMLPMKPQPPTTDSNKTKQNLLN